MTALDELFLLMYHYCFTIMLQYQPSTDSFQSGVYKLFSYGESSSADSLSIFFYIKVLTKFKFKLRIKFVFTIEINKIQSDTARNCDMRYGSICSFSVHQVANGDCGQCLAFVQRRRVVVMLSRFLERWSMNRNRRP